MAGTEFTPRMQQIVWMLLNETEPVPVKKLAEQSHISRRTVQRELKYIRRLLKKYDIEFCSKTGTGIWLEGSVTAISALRQKLESEDVLDISDQSARQNRLILEILKDKTLKKLYYYSELFGVSEATVSSDLEAVKSWFHKYNLEICRKPGYGVYIEGSEKDFRQALRMFIEDKLNTEQIREMYEERSQAVMDVIQYKGENNIYHILDEDIVRRVMAAILKIREKKIRNLTQDSFLGLVIHVAIAVNRIRMKEIIEETEIMIALREDPDYELAKKIVRSLEQELMIQIPEVECAYICLHIKGAKIQQPDINETSRSEIEEYRELWNVVNEMIECYDRDLVYLLHQDEEFVIRGLIAHLKPTLIRLSNGMNIQNPLLDQIKKDYSSIFERCRSAAKIIEDKYGYEMPESEIGFLAIHFGAAELRLKSRKENRRRVKIGIICASGIGISRLMSSKISRDFNNRVDLTAYGMTDLTPRDFSKIDFFVTTMQLKEEADVLYVSPLLPAGDMERIGRKVSLYEYMPMKQADVVNDVHLEQVNFVAKQIKNVIHNLEYQKVDNAITSEELFIAISENLSCYASHQNLIREDLQRREVLGSQIYPELGFALFHARSGGVKRPVFSVCQTKDCGSFTDVSLKGIRVVIVMLIPEDEHVVENSNILGRLSQKLIEEDDFLDVVAGGNREEIKESVSRYLNAYFRQFLEQLEYS